ncbi:MAG: hypothetical protein ACTHN5_15165 [Phycisphaerae bacterium]
MSEPGQGSEYELKPPIPPADVPPPDLVSNATPATPGLKPGDPGWVPPTPIIEKADPEPEPAPEVVEDPDIQKHKGVAILAYIFFVIPLVLAPHSKFARFHANQGLLVFILWCVALVGTVALTIGWRVTAHLLDSIGILQFFFGCLAHVIPVFLMFGALAVTIMGIVHAANGEKKELPLFGHVTLIK